MKKQCRLISLVLCCFTISTSYAQVPTFDSANVKQLLGEWKGNLTYLDYTSKKTYTMPADLKVSQISNSNQLVFSNIYPDEPKANNSDTVTMTKQGTMLDKEVVRSKKLLLNGNTEIITEYAGIDGNDNKAVLIRHTYILGTSIYVKRKDVQFEGEIEWIKRHEYNYIRK